MANKTVDFSKIVIRDIAGEALVIKEGDGSEPYDFARQLGNLLFYQGGDIRMAELGREMYHHRAVELTDAELETVRGFVGRMAPFIQLSALPQIDEQTAAQE